MDETFHPRLNLEELVSWGKPKEKGGPKASFWERKNPG
jgi:hypothetical protein